MTLYRLGRVQGDFPPQDPRNMKVAEYEHLEVYWYESKNATTERLCIARTNQHVKLMLAMMELLSPPFFVLYVLHTSRCGNEMMRYQTPAISKDEVTRFFQTFEDFLDQDGRQDVWLYSATAETTIVWDRHNLMYVYGKCRIFEEVLDSHDLTLGDQQVIDAPHVHCYHSEYDEAESQVVRYFEWLKSPLHPEDEQ